jgi:hypothetical protein
VIGVALETFVAAGIAEALPNRSPRNAVAITTVLIDRPPCIYKRYRILIYPVPLTGKRRIGDVEARIC